MAEFGLGTTDATGRIAAALEEILDARPDLAGQVRATLLILVATGGGIAPPSAAGLLRRLSWTITEPIADALRRSTTALRSEEHTSELQSLMRNSYAVFCLKKKK